MNAELLLDHFDRISGAPDAIPRLRSFVLDLAVRGKLAEQDPNDEPASELLKRLQAEKARLTKGGRLGDQEPLPPIGEAECLFVSPPGWSWARLAAISRRIHYGFTASANALLKDVRLLRITDIQNNVVDWSSVPGCEISEREVVQYRLEKGDILVARTGGTIGKTYLVGQIPVTAVFASYLIRIQNSSEVYDRYLKLFLESPVYWKQLQEGSRGGGQPNVNGQTLGKMTVAVPPLAEQHRIVNKVDELMGLCDRLEETRGESERCRDQLTAASLNNLDSAPNIKMIRAHARFYFRNFPRLTTRVAHIQQLRQTILTLSVRGQLVAQDAEDEPASELLMRIQAEKARLTAKGLLRREKPLPPNDEDKVPFALPGNWVWAKIGSCSLLTEYGTSVKSDTHEEGIPVLAMGDIQDGQVLLSGRKKVPAGIDDLPQLFLKRFDLLYNRTNSAELVGKTGIFLGDDDKYTFASYLIRIRFLNNLTSPAYANLAMGATYFRATQIVPELQQQCGQANVNGTKLRNMLIPFPPLAEQHRIVAKVSELMALCDSLESAVTAGQLKANSLLESVLFNSLSHTEAVGVGQLAIQA